MTRQISSWTILRFCLTCGTEVYRVEHVKRRTEKRNEGFKQAARISFWKHYTETSHREMSGELAINELFGDPIAEVRKIGDQPDGSLHSRSALEVLGVLGLLPFEGAE